MNGPNSYLKEKPKFRNRLIDEKSPYLLQHAHNPIDWHPWCDKAIDISQDNNKLIFVCVGYSTNHLCHVMRKEYFENEDVAIVMNEYYVNILVDREERPDVDRIYTLLMAEITGKVGWPILLLLTPELRPIIAWFYVPQKTGGAGRSQFKNNLLAYAETWHFFEGGLTETSYVIMDKLESVLEVTSGPSAAVPSSIVWNNCIHHYFSEFEPHSGGFGIPPKLITPSVLKLLFHLYARNKIDHTGRRCLDICLYTLTKIANGGIHDHVAGGFGLYSVDNDWHVPHFEKVLFNQAQLLVVYTAAYLSKKDKIYADVVRNIIIYVNKDLRHVLGGYYCAEDSDSYPFVGASRKQEGAMYVWEYKEIESLLGKKQINSISYSDIYCDYFGIEKTGNVPPESDPEGNLINKNVLRINGSKAEGTLKYGLNLEQFEKVINECQTILYNARAKRPRPKLDSKMLCSWNGLMISGLAQAGQGLEENSFIVDAIKTAQFIREYLYDPVKQTLRHTCYRDENGAVTQLEIPVKGFLDDYAFLIQGLLDLYEATFDLNWLNWARELQCKQTELFWDPENGGYFTNVNDTLLLQFKESCDKFDPNGNSVSCYNLQRLAAFKKKTPLEGGNTELILAKEVLITYSNILNRCPISLPEMVSGLILYHDSPNQVVIVGGHSDSRTLELVRAVRSRLIAGRVLYVHDPTAPVEEWLIDIVQHFNTTGEVPTAYVWRSSSVYLPVKNVKDLDILLDKL